MVLNLAHRALLVFSENNPCDHDHPIIMDQIFGAEMKRLENQERIDALFKESNEIRDRIHDNTSLKRVEINMNSMRKLVKKITYELFDVFKWSRITTEEQASWKEYFHMLYDVLVLEIEYDHTGTVLLLKAVTEYHDILEVPVHVQYNDHLYPIIACIHQMFTDLKREQVEMSRSIGNVGDILRDTQKKATEAQHILLGLRRQINELKSDNKKYMKLVKWSIVVPK